MGVEARIILHARDMPSAVHAAQAAYDRIEQIESALSDYRTNGELARLAAIPPGVRSPTSADFRAACSRALEIARLTDGAFDPTISPVVGLWRTARQAGTLPDARALAEALARCGYESVDLDEAGVRFLRGGVRLDFGGIGKGYAAHQALLTLRGLGHPNALVALAGDIAAGDPPPGERGWLVDAGSGRTDGRRLPLSNACLSTSGDTAQFVDIDGVRYSHIVDPRTGLGLTSRIAVTVIADRGEDADAFSSALCVLGPRRGVEVLQRALPTAAAIIEWPDPTDPARMVTLIHDPRRRASESPRGAGRSPDGR